MSDIESPALDYTGVSILGSGELAAKTVGTWLPAPVESVRRGRVWTHRQIAPRPVTRPQAVEAAVRAALEATTIPHHLTQTRPHDRTIRSIALREYGIEPTAAEIRDALIAVMDR